MEKDYKGLYEQIVHSDWFKNAYRNKSLGERPFVVEELEESRDDKMRRIIKLALISREDELRAFYSVHGVTRKECTDWLEHYGKDDMIK